MMTPLFACWRILQRGAAGASFHWLALFCGPPLLAGWPRADALPTLCPYLSSVLLAGGHSCHNVGKGNGLSFTCPAQYISLQPIYFPGQPKQVECQHDVL